MSDITLYELVREGRKGDGFSPFVWKTKVDLAILGVKVNLEKLDFHLIRTDLAKETGNKDVTVPTLKVGGEYITDSWVIAEWLEKHHAKDGKTLFPGGEDAKGLMNFLRDWVDAEFAKEVRSMIGPKVLAILEGASRDHFVNNKLGGAHRVEKFLATADDPSHIKSQTAAARSKLSLIEGMLSRQKSKGNGLWLTGKGPSHADAELFGWYVFGKVNPVVVKEVWNHADLPLVGEWVKGMEQLVGAEALSKASL